MLFWGLGALGEGLSIIDTHCYLVSGVQYNDSTSLYMMLSPLHHYYNIIDCYSLCCAFYSRDLFIPQLNAILTGGTLIL